MKSPEPERARARAAAAAQAELGRRGPRSPAGRGSAGAEVRRAPAPRRPRSPGTPEPWHPGAGATALRVGSAPGGPRGRARWAPWARCKWPGRLGAAASHLGRVGVPTLPPCLSRASPSCIQHHGQLPGGGPMILHIPVLGSPCRGLTPVCSEAPFDPGRDTVTLRDQKEGSVYPVGVGSLQEAFWD
ncbi:translation initiation factor IF-2-like isoform X2 [Mustela putorius furo]|uniref:Translation initiation factor IF-2-like isoform X2 n=1 Tax=Mustela putorius furo TaxID=9669 RepID=A0A8U0V7F8_MUSPF|nr:translation initiation factor IF-2-like isoform X2 [Mustela putorius furo]